jgi:hypothetical protein
VKLSTNSFCIGLPRGVPLDPEYSRQAKNDVSGELGTVVADYHPNASPALNNAVKFARHPQSGERDVHDQAQALPSEVIDYGKDAEAPAADQSIHHEVE